MKLELVTLAGPKLQADVYEVILPTAEGSIAVYPQHMPLVTTIVPGVVTVRRSRTDSNDQLEVFASNGGVAEITKDSLRILVDEADSAEDIVEEEVREALDRAHKLKAEAKDALELAQAETLIDRQAVRLKVAELRRHRPDRRPPIQ
ncbi:MAG TPA: ATP synthase F1 subunit epsilon [Candidatus Saccharimonadales bacterium]|nr:ATP synthase F1 subunit epsilon [Candidatus Saccharimonadales bacterium]